MSYRQESSAWRKCFAGIDLRKILSPAFGNGHLALLRTHTHKYGVRYHGQLSNARLRAFDRANDPNAVAVAKARSAKFSRPDGHADAVAPEGLVLVIERDVADHRQDILKKADRSLGGQLPAGMLQPIEIDRVVDVPELINFVASNIELTAEGKDTFHDPNVREANRLAQAFA